MPRLTATSGSGSLAGGRSRPRTAPVCTAPAGSGPSSSGSVATSTRAARPHSFAGRSRRSVAATPTGPRAQRSARYRCGAGISTAVGTPERSASRSAARQVASTSTTSGRRRASSARASRPARGSSASAARAARNRFSGIRVAGDQATAWAYAANPSPASCTAAYCAAWPSTRTSWPRRRSSAPIPSAGGTAPPPSQVTIRMRAIRTPPCASGRAGRVWRRRPGPRRPPRRCRGRGSRRCPRPSRPPP